MTALPPATRLFTLDEANRTLPLVRLIVRDIVELYPAAQRRHERLAEIESEPPAPTPDGEARYVSTVREMQSELDDDQVRLRGYFEELDKIGAELKDPLVGLVDFPTVIDGEEACLCWKLGEESIGFWHREEAGFAGRLPVDEADQIGPAGDDLEPLP